MTDFPNSPSDSLNGRWSASVTDAVNGQLLRGLPNGSPFGLTPDGYADLRGLEIKVAVKQVNLRRVDFSGCCKSWAGQFGFCTLHDCLFSGSVLPTNFGSDFQRCKFTEAKLKGAVLRGRFEECDFSGADMRKVHFTGSRFVACRFEGARFASGSFARSVFVSCDLKLEWLGNTVVEKVSIS
jgi:uncharacterized protein YjbI with pentapeptide repeats